MNARIPLLTLLALLFGLAVCTPAAAAESHADDTVAYTLTLLPGPPVAVRVTMRVAAEPGTSSRLAIAPSWGGVENCERFVHDLGVTDGAGHACAVTTDPAAPHGWNVAHEPGATLVATYELRPTAEDPLRDFGTHYEPVLRDDLLHLIGETGLIYPEWLEKRGPLDIKFNWSGFKENNWAVVSSFDNDLAAHHGVHRTLQDFRHAMFLAGRVRVQDRTIRGGRLRVAVYSEDWQFTDAEIADLIEKVVVTEREFVRDHSDPYFLVTVVPTGPRATPQSLSQGGTGLTNCFALFLAPGTAVGADARHRKQVLRLLAHEYFHTWNGGKIAMEEPEELVYWFSEGFTEFYASRLLRREGLIDDAEWTTRLNETLRDLWLSPVAREPATTIQRDFWSRREVQQLPYQRGEVVALMLDEEIRRVSKGRKSLDDFFRELLEGARKGEKAQTDRLLTRIGRWTSPAFAESIRRIVVDGAMPEPPGALAEPVLTRTDRETFRFDPGFDLDTALKTKVASGVRADSAAFAAGLRDGQRIDGFSVYHGDPDKEIKLNIRENDEKRSIVYYPRGAPVTIPQYK